MTAREIDETFFESELSLGDEGDRVFLETRHRILTGVYRPGQMLDTTKFAKSFNLSDGLAFQVIQALSDHGYLVDWQLHRAQIVSWSDSEIVDFLSTLRQMVEFMVAKAAMRNDKTMISMLRKAMDIDLSAELTPEICESFQIRWWIYWHTMLYSTEVKDFRKIVLVVIPPVMRRRLILALDDAGLRSMQSHQKALVDAIEDGHREKITTILTHQWERWVPSMVLHNSRYQSLADEREIDYDDRSLPTQPIFKKEAEPATRMQVGLREPLNWKEFEAMGIL
jgi:DNA-binding GntR family transcriptional regulator